MTITTQNPKIDAQFAKFHEANPHVFEKYRAVACELRKSQRRGSSEQVFQILRWEMRFETTDMASYFKISNNYRRRYALLLAAVDPSFADWFVFRDGTKTRKVK